MASSAPQPMWDVFVSYSRDDREWVTRYLLPALEEAGLKAMLLYRDFPIGAPIGQSIEQGILGSRHTILVLTPSLLEDEWQGFLLFLGRHQDPAYGKRTLLPLLLKPCELPSELSHLDYADFTTRGLWEAESARLARTIQGRIPVPAPWKASDDLWKLRPWLRWLRFARRRLLAVAGLGAFALLLLMLLAGLGPFAPAPGWRSVSPAPPPPHDRFTSAITIGETSLLGTNADTNTELDAALVRREGDGPWERVVIPAIHYQSGSSETSVAGIFGFAWVTPTATLYATTDGAGVLVSADDGRTWARTPNQPQALDVADAIAFLPDPARLFVAAHPQGLFSLDPLTGAWEQVDGASRCEAAAGNGPLPPNLPISRLLAHGSHILAATGDPWQSRQASGLWASSDGGTCWRRVDDGQGSLQYLALAGIPGQPSSVIVATYESNQPAGQEVATPYTLQVVDVEAGLRLRTLWNHTGFIADLMVSPEQPEQWYALTHGGAVYTGSVGRDGVALLATLPFYPHGVFLNAERFAPPHQGESAPRLLAGRRLYEFSPALNWWERLWQGP